MDYLTMMRLIQLRHPSAGRRVAIVAEPTLVLMNATSIYELAQAALCSGNSMAESVRQSATQETISYDAVYSYKSDWQILPSFHHPEEPARCLVSGTGLTHKGSAEKRHAMHTASEAELTDSMKMFRLGLDGGRPEGGKIGAAPEWFYKGNGTILRGDGEALSIPVFAEDGGEEAEIAGVYIVDGVGRPRRIGMTVGNEFSDHRLERRNYLYLAHSKLRCCAIGPELVVDAPFKLVPGVVMIERGGECIWSKEIASGEEAMCHSLVNIEHHHFKYEAHRRPGDVHIHFFGADALSFGEGIQLQDGDVLQVAFEGFGRALRNTVRVDGGAEKLVEAAPL